MTIVLIYSHSQAVLISRSANDETGKSGACAFKKCVINNLPFEKRYMCGNFIAMLNMAILFEIMSITKGMLIQP